MADSTVIREFLVALGFKVDEKGLKNFRTGVEDATKSVVRLVATISGAALTVGAGVAAFASKLERLYFVAQRTGAAETSLKSLSFAAQNFGVSSEQALGSVESLARFLRNVPGSEGLLQQLGIQTRDANGNLRDSVDLLTDLGGTLAKMPQYEANAYGGVFGIDENLLLAMRNGDFAKFVQQYRDMSKSTGLDKASDDAHQFMVQLRHLSTEFENLGIKVEGVLLHKIGPQLEQFAAWMDEHGEQIADRVGDIASAFISAAAAMGPPLKWMADKLVELDKATGGWSTRALALLGVLRLLGGAAVVGGIAGLATAVASVGAAFAGWKIGDSIRDEVDRIITKKSGGKHRSLWDIITGTDRSGLDATGGFTQEEIDSVKDHGGAKLATGPRPDSQTTAAGPAAARITGTDRYAMSATGGTTREESDSVDSHGGAKRPASPRGSVATSPADPTAARGLQQRALEFFQRAGWTLQQAAGVVSNLWSESALRADVPGDNGTAYGIGQWHADRQADFAAWAGKNIRDSSLDEQLAFVNFELTKGKESAAGLLLRAAQNANQAGQVVSRYYERPRDADGEAARRGRQAVHIANTTTINVDGSKDPQATAREVARQQAEVADQLAGTMGGMIE
ncbi:mannosyl-glycoprotein endo-beta-N-acetylglucosamidase [Burkholderia glumae]|uniref:phage tail tip lysozyme n=1 Tax=Burkholderia glumae TaxID=337 RepID=UPI000F5FA51C|nr:phage tail tip lysozyme [Burkholderia glumae]RQZ76389.1 mannosyl-glycoprotein endo-beta-N-acetylglucosamidase [Burkholderia glumae]